MRFKFWTLIVWACAALVLGLLITNARGQQRAPDTSVRLVMVYDYGPKSIRMMDVVSRLKAAGYDAVSTYADDPRNKPYLERFKITKARLPFFVMYRGHEALEEVWDTLTERALVEWFHRAARSESSLGYINGAAPSKSQAFLTALDKPALKWRLSPGSCGMLGCTAHGGGWVLEKELWNASCPNGTCPSGRCPR